MLRCWIGASCNNKYLKTGKRGRLDCWVRGAHAESIAHTKQCMRRVSITIRRALRNDRLPPIQAVLYRTKLAVYTPALRRFRSYATSSEATRRYFVDGSGFRSPRCLNSLPRGEGGRIVVFCLERS